MMSGVVVALLVVLSTAVSVSAQSCNLFSGSCGQCTNTAGCGWCTFNNRCVPGGNNGPTFTSDCPCTSFYYNPSQCNTFNNPSCRAATSTSWVTAVWVTIVILLIIAIIAYWIRRRRMLYYIQQAQAQQATVITTQSYASPGAPVMATVASPVMATMAQPQPMYTPAPQYSPQQQQPPQTGEGQPQPMYATPSYGQQQPGYGYPPGYSPQPGYPQQAPPPYSQFEGTRAS